ncbi:MAG: acriflavin resistance protein [Candidatus Sericytochromatia bacterium]|nr:MAG: acriflavin resistance protein [Candidatus Sericytochromatia bacterium]
MKLTNLAIRNPTTIIVLVLLIIILGYKTYKDLPREAAPDIKVPTLIVTTPYFGVSPSDIETLITIPLEKKIKEIKDIKELRSTSAESASMIIIEFNAGVDIDSALQKVRDKVDLAKPDLPKDAEEPIITEINFADFPIMLIAISGNTSLVNLKKIADDFKDKIDTIPGILDVKITGGLTREIHVEIDPDRLKFYELSYDAVINAIRLDNLNIPGGKIKLGSNQFLVRVPSEYEKVSEIENTVVKVANGKPILIKDIGVVKDTFKERETISRLNGKPSVTVSVQKRSGENIIEITDEVKKRLEQFKNNVSPNINFTITLDASKDIRNMVSDLENNIISGLILVLAVLFIFMDWKSAFFVSTAIPLSMLISFIVLKALGITLNMVVLFSLILALGMLVDNGIVIVENIYRHQQEGKEPIEAAKIGVAEVEIPVIASTLTTLAAFAPMIFWPGIMGEFMSYLPKMVIIVLTASLFVALIINPVMCAYMLKVKEEKIKTAESEDNIFIKTYKNFLFFSLKHKYLFILVSFLTLVLTFIAYRFLNHGIEFFPSTDPRRINITIKAPDGTTLEESDRISRIVEERLKKYKDIDYFVTNVGTGGNQGGFGGSESSSNYTTINVDFVDRKLRSQSSLKTTDEIRKDLKDIAGVEIEIKKEQKGPPAGYPVNVEIAGDSFEMLGKIAQNVKNEIASVRGLVDLKDNFSTGKKEIRIIIDKEKAQVLKLNTQGISNAIRTAFNGTKASVFREEDEEYDIIVKLPEEKRNNINSLKTMYISGKDDVQVPLEYVAKIYSVQGYGSIRRLNQSRVITVSANVEGRNANEALQEVIKIVNEKIKLPSGYTIRYTGENKEKEAASKFLSNAFLIGVFLIIMILVFQFNSIVLPSIIMFSVILSLVGVLWGLIITRTPFGVIMTGIGVISLAGVVVNNSIVLIDYIQQLRKEGLNKIDAIIKAGATRLRPVLLTAITTILGLLPMVLGINIDFVNMTIDSGSDNTQWWGPMAVAVFYGLTFSTILTLVFVPVMYLTITDNIDKFKGLLLKISNRKKIEKQKFFSKKDIKPLTN